MTKLFKYFVIIFLFSINTALALENKILFKVNNKIITSIDILNESNYLKALNKKESNLIGSLKNNFNENLSFNYDFSINNQYDELEYSSIGTTFSVNNFVTTFNYIEENNNIGSAHAIENTTSYNIDSSNSLLFRTRRNKETDLTEYYDLIYEYKNDCLVAGMSYKKSYYSDRELKPTEDIMFTIKLTPLTTFNQSVEK